MNRLDQSDISLCKLQAEAFEQSVDGMDCSSDIFIRRFMNSNIVKKMDHGETLAMNWTAGDFLIQVDEQYGRSSYGSVKYTKNEMYWMGYLYRYFALMCDKSSTQVYKLVKPKELRELFLPYHTMDPAQAVERILEAKQMLRDEEAELQRQYEIFKKVRGVMVS